MKRSLYVAWQDPLSRRWFPIGQLTVTANKYTYSYTKGALQANSSCDFQGLQCFPELGESYQSTELFPIFENRLLSHSRPEYQDFIQWLNLSVESQDAIAVLSRTGGERETDTLQVFPCPQPDRQNFYRIHFFAHGIRHVEGGAERIESLRPGDKLILVTEDNPYDQWALRVEHDGALLGYCPRYVNRDFHKLMELSGDSAGLRVERINPSHVPVQFKLLCEFACPWPEGFAPFDYEEYKTVVLAKR
jgi:hypothetical protein